MYSNIMLSIITGLGIIAFIVFLCLYMARKQSLFSVLVNLATAVIAFFTAFCLNVSNHIVVCLICMLVWYVPIVTCFIIDTSLHPELKRQTFLGWKTHLGWLLVIALLTWCCNTWLTSKQEVHHQLKYSSLETIHEVVILPIVQQKRIYNESSWDDTTYIFRPDTVQTVFLLLQSAKIIEVEPLRKGVNYDLLYPSSDTITVYQGKYIKPRKTFVYGN